MENNNFIFDITDVDIDISLNRAKRVEYLLDFIESTSFGKKLKVNDTIIFTNFLSDEKLSSKSIIKVLS